MRKEELDYEDFVLPLSRSFGDLADSEIYDMPTEEGYEEYYEDPQKVLYNYGDETEDNDYEYFTPSERRRSLSHGSATLPNKKLTKGFKGKLAMGSKFNSFLKDPNFFSQNVKKLKRFNINKKRNGIASGSKTPPKKNLMMPGDSTLPRGQKLFEKFLKKSLSVNESKPNPQQFETNEESFQNKNPDFSKEEISNVLYGACTSSLNVETAPSTRNRRSTANAYETVDYDQPSASFSVSSQKHSETLPRSYNFKSPSYGKTFLSHPNQSSGDELPRIGPGFNLWEKQAHPQTHPQEIKRRNHHPPVEFETINASDYSFETNEDSVYNHLEFNRS